jgi:DNA-binding transcriptional LysR family regulator
VDRLQSMAVFVRVAEQGSFSLAAHQMGLSKSAVSKHVAALEEHLGVRLLNRTTRRLVLTEVGSVYRDHCARVVQEVEEADLAASEHSLTPRGRLKVNAPVTFGFLHLGPLVPEFLASHPAIRLELTLNDRVVDLLEEGFDLAVRIGRLADSSLIARRLATTGFVCAAAPAYLARTGTPAEPGDLAHHNCLRYTYRPQPEGWSFSRGGEQVTVRIGGNLEANNGDALRAAARAGLGIVYLPDFIAAADVASGALVRLLAGWEAPQLPIHAVFPPQRHPSAKLRAFVDFLAAHFGRGVDWAETCRAAAPASGAG